MDDIPSEDGDDAKANGRQRVTGLSAALGVTWLWSFYRDADLSQHPDGFCHFRTDLRRPCCGSPDDRRANSCSRSSCPRRRDQSRSFLTIRVWQIVRTAITKVSASSFPPCLGKPEGFIETPDKELFNHKLNFYRKSRNDSMEAPLTWRT